ncbi:MAG: kelch repeat-containing protein, partial [Planctomycetota bacterium]
MEGELLKDRFSPKMAYNSTVGSLVLFGGWDGSRYLRDTWVWDGNLWTQRSEFGQNSPPPRTSHAMAHDSTSG